MKLDNLPSLRLVYALVHTPAVLGHIFTVNCKPLTIQRADPILFPGVVSPHVHTVVGGTAFALTETNEEAKAANATTCDKTLDNSNYWQPQLYHQRFDGKFELVEMQGIMAFPSIGDYNTGVCPPSHPKAILSVFLEFFYDTAAVKNFNRLVWSMGDPTGYGLHGDFINGWTDQQALERAMDTCTGSLGVNDPRCSLNVGPNGPGQPSLQSPQIEPPNEDVGLRGPLDRLPGDNPVTGLDLVTYSLTSKIPPFTALSYVWGDPADRVTSCWSGGKTVSMTRNLSAILQCLTSSMIPGSEPFLLWIDALCINQADLKERAEQVKLMNQIYSRANPVLVFLSTTSAPFEVGLNFLRQAAAHPDWHYEPSMQPHLTLSSGLDAHSETLRNSVIAIFAAPWWTRVWTVQEFVLSGRVVFRCGDEEMDEATLLAAFESLKTHESSCCWAARREANGDSKGYLDLPSVANGGLSLYQATMRFDQLHVMRNAQAFDARSLLGALATFRTRQCVDARDHIFGMLGLDLGSESRELKARLKVDYTVSPKELFADVACSMIHSSGCLDVLSHVCQYASTRGQLSGLPSWVADWTATVDETFHHYYSERTRRIALSNASMDLEAEWQRLSDGRLSTKAIIIGYIKTVVSGYQTSNTSLFGEKRIETWIEVFTSRCNWDSDCQHLLHNGPAHPKDEGKPPISEFSEMITAGHALVGWQNDPGRQLRAFKDWRDWLAHQDPEALPEDTRQNARNFDDLVKLLGKEMSLF
ncbi:hypothetical protein CP532_3339 [Ophiocordyceps camponoti-leonardi (nom. inval.)]|nr:hypothetical protein CP532_3339 [Ophiocordyceps camponoti-leonardi (nom. inval.)]